MGHFVLKSDVLNEFPECVMNFCFNCFASRPAYFEIDQYNSLVMICGTCNDESHFCNEVLPDLLLVEIEG